jgi:regulator of replication initiation timing
MFLTLLMLSSLHAEDLDMEMQKIRKASPQERVKLMNELKRRIAQMNVNERNDAISRLRSQVKTKKQNIQTITKQQFHNSHDSFSNQRNNQQQIGSQFTVVKERLDVSLPRF